MDFQQARFNMVEQQVRPWNVIDQQVLDALMSVPREDFVPEACRQLAFSEAEIPIGQDQVMLKPIIEGKILQALRPCAMGHVLEVGSGSGYFSALLALWGAKVHSYEIMPQLAAFARQNLARAGVERVQVHDGNGCQAAVQHGPFDLIVLSGGVVEVPQGLLAQLKPGGVLFAFVGAAPMMEACRITCLDNGDFRTEVLFESLVPMLQNAVAGEHFDF